MEQQQQYKKLKQSCEGCTHAKLKCTSTFPSCDRCLKKGIPCVYVEERRRGRPNKQKYPEEEQIRKKIILNIMSHLNNHPQIRAAYDIVSPLSIPIQRRIIAAFFVTYFPDDQISQSFFNQNEISEQSRKILRFMYLHGHGRALEETGNFLTFRNVNIDDSLNVLASPKGKNISDNNDNNNAKSLHTDFLSWNPSPTEISLVLDTLNDQLRVKVSNAFTQTFGYTSTDLNYMLEYCIGGLLPWGGDLMSILLSDEDECVIKYLRKVEMEILAHQNKSMLSTTTLSSSSYLLSNTNNTNNDNIWPSSLSTAPIPPELEVISFSYPCILLTKSSEKVSCKCHFVCRSPRCFNRSKIQLQIIIDSYNVFPNENTASPNSTSNKSLLSAKSSSSLIANSNYNKPPLSNQSSASNVFIFPTSFKDTENDDMDVDIINNEWLDVLVEDWKKEHPSTTSTTKEKF